MTRQAASAAAAISIGLAALSGTGTAMAASTGATPSLHGCPTNYVYSTFDRRHYFVAKISTSAPAGSSVPLRLSVSKGTTVSGKVSGSGDYTENGLIESVKVHIAGSISLTKKTQVKQSWGYKIPKSWGHGWLAWGAWGYSFKWEYGHGTAKCGFVVKGHGTARLPANKTGFAKGKGFGPPKPKF